MYQPQARKLIESLETAPVRNQECEMFQQLEVD